MTATKVQEQINSNTKYKYNQYNYTENVPRMYGTFRACTVFFALSLTKNTLPKLPVSFMIKKLRKGATYKKR